MYNGDHSVTFGEKNSWKDWFLIPSSRPVINPPSVKTHYVDVPGGNGKIDLTESLTGHPVYDNRTGSLEFYVENGHKDWDVLYSEISNYLHGKTMKIVLEDAPYFYYEGRYAVNNWKSDPGYSIITIDYDVYPYAKEPSSLEPWLWNPFDFELGVIREYSSMIVKGRLDLEIVGREEHVIPIIEITTSEGTGMDVEFEGSTYHFPDGETRNRKISIGGGETKIISFIGTGKVTVDYQGGSL